MNEYEENEFDVRVNFLTRLVQYILVALSMTLS